jgi:copper transport protein
VARRVATLGVLLAALFGVLFVAAGPASAHASVVSSDPVDGSRLKAAPAAVTITFDQPVGLGDVGYLHVTDQNGNKVDAGSAFHPNGNGAQVEDKLKPGLGDGTYTASFRIISADSHPVAGTVRFVVGNGVLSAAPPAGATVNHATTVVFDMARWVSFAGFALIAGAWLWLSVWPAGRSDRRARAVAWTGVGSAAVGAVAETVLQGPYTAGTGLSNITRWQLLDSTLHASFGEYHCVRLVLIGVIALFFGVAMQPVDSATPRREFVPGAFFALLVVAMAYTFAEVGHPETTSPTWVSVPDDMAHVVAMGVWLGGLVLLAACVFPRRDPDELRVVLPIFSRVALVAIGVLAASGTYLALRGVQTVDAIFTTTYGLLVVVKVALLCGIVALGYGNRSVLRRRDPVGSAERVRRAVLVEVVLAIGILVATSLLVAQPRGAEALAVVRAQPRSGAVDIGGGRIVTVTLDPGKHGDIAATVVFTGTQPVQVTATAVLPSQELGPIPLDLRPNGHDIYGASGVLLPAAGNWRIDLVVTTSKFSATTASVTIHLY